MAEAERAGSSRLWSRLWSRSASSSGACSGAAPGAGELIAAPDGAYKQKPAEPGGMKVEGQGDAAYAASAGADVNAAIDIAALPEAPVAGAGRVTAPGVRK